jgi:hypothetical protein
MWMHIWILETNVLYLCSAKQWAISNKNCIPNILCSCCHSLIMLFSIYIVSCFSLELSTNFFFFFTWFRFHLNHWMKILEQKQSIEFTQYHLKIIRITYLWNVRCLKLGFSHCSYFYVSPGMWHFYRIPHQHPFHILSKLYQWIGMSMPCRGLYHLFPTLKDM